MPGVISRLGRLDVLVNNAGTASVSRRGFPPSQSSLEDMRAVYEINGFHRGYVWTTDGSGGYGIIPW